MVTSNVTKKRKEKTRVVQRSELYYSVDLGKKTKNVSIGLLQSHTPVIRIWSFGSEGQNQMAESKKKGKTTHVAPVQHSEKHFFPPKVFGEQKLKFYLNNGVSRKKWYLSRLTSLPQWSCMPATAEGAPTWCYNVEGPKHPSSLTSFGEQNLGKRPWLMSFHRQDPKSPLFIKCSISENKL